MITVLLVFSFMLMALFDAPDLIRKKYWWELAIYSSLMLAALILSIMLVMGTPFPAFTTEIENFIESIFHLK